MRDITLKAFLYAVAAAATTMDLIFLVPTGAYHSVESASDAVWMLIFWVVTMALALVGSFLPAAAIAAASQRFHIRSPVLLIGASGLMSLLLAGSVAGLLWSPNVPPSDPDYLAYEVLLWRVVIIFVPGGLVGGLVYWALALRNVPPRRPGYYAFLA